MSETKDVEFSNIIIGVPEELEAMYKTEKNCLCCECELKETNISRVKEELSYNSLVRRIQPVLHIKEKEGVYDIDFISEGKGLKVEIENFSIYPPFDILNPFPRTI